MSTPIQKVLTDAKMTEKDISQIVLVGGSCKMEIVKRYLQHIFRNHTVLEIEPDYMIALGVGTYAGI